ncbi:hypothetical protein JL721_577 [Aureococcus anophagefferens]|nr:hypothetical protein JL721_577 [Aureococcus anophagefferens]
MEAKVTLWREVEAGTRNTIKTAMERYPQLNKNSCDREGLRSEIALKPKSYKQAACDVKTYLAADVDDLVARLAAPPEPDAVDPRWLEVEADRRYTQTTATKRYPQLTFHSFADLPFEIALKPKSYKQAARDVKIYLAADVDALVARLAAPPEPASVDPRWREVEAGTRYTMKTAMKRYPQLNKHSFDGLPSEVARQPKQSDHACSRARDVKTYLAADVDALVACLAAPDPEPVDPRWLEVKAGARYDWKTAKKRYPQLNWRHLEDLPFEIARRPKPGKGKYACDVKTFLAADVDKLAASRANKRARVQEPEPPQEPKPEPEEEPEECPVCLETMTGAIATLRCGHLFCKDCITDWASSQTTCPTCRETLEIAP